MGCCGCDNKTSTITAGVSAIVQCIFGLVLSVYQLETFSKDCSKEYLKGKYYLCYVLNDFKPAIVTTLIIAVLFYIIWGISSVLLLIGNARNREDLVRQWLFISVIFIISDAILSYTIIGLTFNVILRNYERSVVLLVSWNRQEIITRASVENLTWHYFLLIISLARGGLITWITEIAFTMYTKSRVQEIRNSSATEAFAQTFQTSLSGTANPNQLKTSLRRLSSSSRIKTLSFRTANTVLSENPAEEDDESTPNGKDPQVSL